jgi:hypothetical protein
MADVEPTSIRYAYVVRLTKRTKADSPKHATTREAFWASIPDENRRKLSAQAAGEGASPDPTQDPYVLERALCKTLENRLLQELGAKKVHLSIAGYGSVTLVALVDAISTIFSWTHVGAVLAVCANEILGVPFYFDHVAAINKDESGGPPNTPPSPARPLPARMQNLVAAVGLVSLFAAVCLFCFVSISWDAYSRALQGAFDQQSKQVATMFQRVDQLDRTRESTMLIAGSVLADACWTGAQPIDRLKCFSTVKERATLVHNLLNDLATVPAATAQASTAPANGTTANP